MNINVFGCGILGITFLTTWLVIGILRGHTWLGKLMLGSMVFGCFGLMMLTWIKFDEQYTNPYFQTPPLDLIVGPGTGEYCQEMAIMPPMHGRVQDSEGHPIENARVDMRWVNVEHWCVMGRDLNWTNPHYEYTNADGEFYFEANYRRYVWMEEVLVVSKDDYQLYFTKGVESYQMCGINEDCTLDDITEEDAVHKTITLKRKPLITAPRPPYFFLGAIVALGLGAVAASFITKRRSQDADNANGGEEI